MNNMTGYTEAQSKAIKKYLSKKDSLTLRLPKGYKEKIKAIADSQGISMNDFICQAVESALMLHPGQLPEGSGASDN